MKRLAALLIVWLSSCGPSEHDRAVAYADKANVACSDARTNVILVENARSITGKKPIEADDLRKAADEFCNIANKADDDLRNEGP